VKPPQTRTLRIQTVKAEKTATGKRKTRWKPTEILTAVAKKQSMLRMTSLRDADDLTVGSRVMQSSRKC
jgi:hypothetical protein